MTHNDDIFILLNQIGRAEKRVIAEAMLEYHKYTCIRFIPRMQETSFITLQKTGRGFVLLFYFEIYYLALVVL